jgi:hypothetical protein
LDEVLQEWADFFADAITAGATPEAAQRRLERLRVPREQVAEILSDWEARVGRIIRLEDPEALVRDRPEWSGWYTGPRPEDRFWPGVRQRLLSQLDAGSVASIDEASSRILSLMDPPGQHEIHTRGLVLGHVQSGKTTSFMSVAAKAADRGYKLVIVLSGITDNLRIQTQSRLEQVLVGDRQEHWHLLTTKESDFAGSGNAVNLLSQNHVVLAIVKKNPHRLRRVRNWIRQAGESTLRNAPILLIDDEADQASINVGNRGRTSVINRLIREILDQPKAAYLAYTATPFANVFIDPNNFKDLYPRDFIVALSRPDDYWGAERIFGRDPIDLDEAEKPNVATSGLDVVRSIPTADEGASRPPKGRGAVHGWTPGLTSSLEDALLWFLLATSARRVRDGSLANSSMLIHTSMLAEAHRRLAVPIRQKLREWAELREADDQGFKGLIRELWEAETRRLPAAEMGRADVDFSEIWGELPRTFETGPRVIIDNYLAQAADRLTYPGGEPQTVVVIGGNTLSRGLTLEGLVCSYFVRAATAYDTLLQMGRWFGYRRGYEDLVRLWITDDLAGWFRDLAMVETEIRSEISRYSALDRRPEELAVRVRTHPAMEIVAKAKMGAAQRLSSSYSGGKPQTILFRHRDADWLAANLDACRGLIRDALERDAEARKFGSGYYGLSQVPAGSVLRFLGRYQVPDGTTEFKPANMRKYVERENAAGALLRWNVAIIARHSESPGSVHLGLPTAFKPIQRSKLRDGHPERASIGTLTSTADRVADLDLAAAQVTRRAPRRDDASLAVLRDEELPGVGLLCLYPIDALSRFTGNPGQRPRADLDAAAVVMGAAIFFPEAADKSNAVEYMSVVIDAGETEDPQDEVDDILAADSADEQDPHENRQEARTDGA